MALNSVDPEALRAGAQRLAVAADVLTAAAGALRHLRFDGSVAGPAYTDSAWRLRAAMDALGSDVARWAHAAGELAAALRSGADLRSDADAHAAVRLR